MRTAKKLRPLSIRFFAFNTPSLSILREHEHVVRSQSHHYRKQRYDQTAPLYQQAKTP